MMHGKEGTTEQISIILGAITWFLLLKKWKK
jgi:hypothetical protein